MDWDKVIKYKTQKVVNMIDMRLGLLKHAITILVILYIALFVFWFSKGYLEEEIAVGQVELQVRGKSHFKWKGQDYLVDAIDMTDPSIEHGALFVISRQEVVRQTRGRCGNPFNTCDTDKDCPVMTAISEGKCVEGFCEELGWCPPLDPADTDNTMVKQFENPENLTIWIRAAITFPGLDENKTFTTMNDEKPIFEEDNPELANAFLMIDLLDKAGISPKSVIQDGCFLSVRMNWDCYIDTGEGCFSPNLEVKRLDVGQVAGFDFYDANYVRSPDNDPKKEYRFYIRQVGFRLLVSSKGTGYKVSQAAIILQISAGVALLGLSTTIADALMLQVLPEREQYRKYKEDVTPDFSDLRDKILDDQNDSKAKLREQSKTSRYEKLFRSTQQAF